jgi:transposase InsO family protein
LGILFAGKISNLRDFTRILETGSKRVRLRIKKIRSDNGTKFKNSQIEGFLEDERIKHEFSSPYTPQQNGVMERKNRTPLDMARTMLDEYKTPDRFWAEAINTACYSINRLYRHRILKKNHMNSSPEKSPMFHILESLVANVLFLLKEVENLNLLLSQ